MGNKSWSVNEVLDFAIAREVEAIRFYRELAAHADDLAMKKEKAAYRLYLDLAVMAQDEATKNLFLALAGEEARHKLRFEIEYDDHILRED